MELEHGLETTPRSADEAPPERRALAFAYRELLSPRIVGFVITTSGIVVGIVALFGPIGSYESLSLLQRLVYAAVCGAFGAPPCYSMMVVTLYYLRDRTPAMGALAVSLTMLVAAVPCAALASAYQTLFFGDQPVYDGFLEVYLLVASFGVPCCLLFLYIVCQRLELSSESTVSAGTTDTQGGAGDGDADGERAGEGDAEGERAGDGDADGERAVDGLPAAAEAHARFFERLPDEIGRELVYIKTEDHYLEVHTTTGSTRVLVRFGDAVGELGELGIQVHRCYWVAHRQMAELVTRGHRTLLRLADEREVPVSRTYLPDVKAVLGA